MRIKFLAFGLLALIGGCATGSYEQAVTEFAEATATATEAVGELAGQLEKRERERRIVFATTYPRQLSDIGLSKDKLDAPVEDLLLDDSQGGCTSADEACLLVLRNYRGAPATLEPGPQLVQINRLVREIQIYSANLQVLAKADTRKEAEGSIDAINGQAKEIAKLLSREAPESISAIGDLAEWITGTYLESMKINALRKATEVGEKALGETAEFLSALADLSVDAVRFTEAGLYFEAREAVILSDMPTRAKIEAWEAARQRLDSLLKLRNGGVFEKMRTAHNAIYRALQPSQFTFEEALMQVKKYRESAEELLKVMKRLDKNIAQEG